MEISMSTHPAKDRSSLCTHTFADGRRCRTPRCSNHPYLCYFHARREAQALAGQQLGDDIAYLFSGSLITAGDLNAVLAQVFAGLARGHIKPGAASALGYLGQTMLQNIQNTRHEYMQACGLSRWQKDVHTSIVNNIDFIEEQFAQRQPAPDQPRAAQFHAPTEASGTEASANSQAEAGTQLEPVAQAANGDTEPNASKKM
jgi:hypothetical protein